jgi:predicted metal-binding membrane protein
VVSKQRAAPAAVLAAVAAACWAITANRMKGMDMGPGTDLGGLGWFAVAWVTMMAAMMLPSLIPMALAFAGPSRDPRAAFVFAGGYLLTWLGAGLLAYAVIDGVRSLDPSWLAWGEGGRYLAAGVILGAALYELTPLKSRCLSHCRRPELLARRRRPGLPGALAAGVEHGGFCVGSSGALMAALIALGVMNVAWMIVVAALVALEKLLPWGGVASAATVAFIAALGIAVALAPEQVPGLMVPG